MRTPALLTHIKPLHGAHWLLSLAIVASAVLLTSADPCRQVPLSWQAAWLAAVIAIVVWSNHLRVAPVQSLRALLLVLGRSGWELIKLATTFFLVTFALALVMPTVSCMNDRAKTGMMMVATSAQRAEIAERILQRGNVAGAGQGMVFNPSDQAKAGLIQDDGSMVVVSDDPPAAIFLVPSIDATGKVQWSCKGVPEKAVPLPCRQPSP